MANRDGECGEEREGCWYALVVEIPTEREDELVGHLLGMTRGVELFDGKAGARGIRLVLGNGMDAEACREYASTVLTGMGLVEAGRALRVERLTDERWAERYQASLAPFDLGTRFRVFPAGTPGDPGEREAIVLIPGRAFGTGEHATTRMGVEWLEKCVVPGQRWLDLGCGTGILAFVASRLGASEVQALDLDPQAIEVCREVLASNGAGEGIQIGIGTVPGGTDGRFEGVVANIHAPHFLGSGPAGLREILHEGGTLLATGFSENDAAEVTEALQLRGFEVEERTVQSPWALLKARAI